MFNHDKICQNFMGMGNSLTLAACTTDSVFNGADQQRNGSQTENSDNGGMTTFSDDGDYQSYEVVLEDGTFPHQESFTHTVGGKYILIQ